MRRVRFEQRTRPPGILICLLWGLATVGWVMADLPGRAVIGLPFLLFIPGYVLVLALFPGQDIDVVERVALSFGLSIAVVPLIGIALNYTPWGIRLAPILFSLLGAVVGFAAVAWYRWRLLHPAQRFVVSVTVEVPREERRLDRALNVALLVSIGIAMILLVYVIMVPQVGESFTELYVLGPGGRAADYPTHIVVGENASVVVGIANHEQKRMHYTLEIWLVNYSYYLGFDGVDDYIKIPDSTSLDLTDEITIEWWAYLGQNQSGWYTGICKPHAWQFRIRGINNTSPGEVNIVFYCDNGTSDLYTGYYLQQQKWYHLAATYKPLIGRTVVYINGESVASKTDSEMGNIEVAQNGLIFGKINSYFDGRMRDIRIYKRALTSQEIENNYRGNVTREGLVSWWKLSDGFSDCARDYIGSNDGQIHGASWASTGDVQNMWFMDSMAIQLNHTAVDVEGNWTPQWEHTHTFSVDREGIFKLAFLVLTNETERFTPGHAYLNRTARLDEAYREAHLWVRVYPERLAYIAQVMEAFFTQPFVNMLPIR